MGVVAVPIWFLVDGGAFPGGRPVFGLGARWVLQLPQVVLLPVLGFQAGLVGWRAVVVVVGLVVVVVVVVVVVSWVVVVVVVVVLVYGVAVVVVIAAVVLVVVVVVLRLVVLVVLRVCPQDPSAVRWHKGLEHGVQPLGLQGLVNG